ncbi:MAG: DUF452 family protein [Muribaculaceae bacterium]|nr:DUF452 family protein [Muribaculaceae bacterium]
MKIEFIKRGAATRLILIFAGWSTDSRYYSDCVADGWDTAVVSDYRDMSMPPIPSQYSTVYMFAYSLGVAAASLCNVPAAVRIAICGSLSPVSDDFGIPESVYAGTLDGLSERSLMKFHLRMAGDKATYESIKFRLPENPDISFLKDELRAIRNYSGKIYSGSGRMKFDRAYIAENDRIFPPRNLQSFWNSCGETETVILNAPHAVDLASIIQECLPDTKAIGEGFSSAGKSYNENAVVQKEICDRMCEKLGSFLLESNSENISVLEIGTGNGLLTEEWRKILTPEKATYVDLTEMPVFGAAEEELYVKADAEVWLEETDEKFDIILSASTIQWFADPVRFISTVRHHLNPGGIAILSTFVKGNLKELDALRPSPIIYRTVEEYGAITGVIIDDWERKLTFKSSREMLMHLHLTGVSPRRHTAPAPLRNLPSELTYHPLILIIPADQ